MTNLPQPTPPGDVWGRFSVDPRGNPAVRASDGDRDVAAEVVNAAFSDGRLDNLEHADRLEAVLRAKTLGDLVPLIADVTVASRPTAPRTPVAAARRTALRSWVGLALLFNAIWVATWLLAGIPPYYYWPMWPMIGTAIPVVIAYLYPDRAASDPVKPAEFEQRRQARRTLREQSRQARRTFREQRRELGR